MSSSARVVKLSDVQPGSELRWSSGLPEFDRALGGGLVPGGVTLIGGDPGIGKSTLTLQAIAALSGQMTTLYVSGEESPRASCRARHASRAGLKWHQHAG